MGQRSTWLWVLCGVAALAMGCSPLAGPGGGALLAVGASLLLLSSLRPARAGAPVGCDGEESTLCENGYLTRQCCPKGHKCNYARAEYLDCGQYGCVVGGDVGRCPTPQPSLTGDKDAASCRGQWAEACVEGRVTKACIMPVHTNYSGPSHNPSWRTCGPDAKRCTTHQLLETCHPARGEISDAACAKEWHGQWTKVCLAGKVAERCLPRGAKADAFPATRFVGCGGTACAVGEEKKACGN